MENLIFGIGTLVTLILIWRYATKKVGKKAQSPSRAPDGGAVAPVAAKHLQGATLGTLLMVNIICAIGSGIFLALQASDVSGVVYIVGSLSIFVFPIIAFKVLEAIEARDSYSLMGCLCGLCVLAWLLVMPWFVMDIGSSLRGA